MVCIQWKTLTGVVLFVCGCVGSSSLRTSLGPRRGFCLEKMMRQLWWVDSPHVLGDEETSRPGFRLHRIVLTQWATHRPCIVTKVQTLWTTPTYEMAWCGLVAYQLTRTSIVAHQDCSIAPVNIVSLYRSPTWSPRPAVVHVEWDGILSRAVAVFRVSVRMFRVKKEGAQSGGLEHKTRKPSVSYYMHQLRGGHPMSPPLIFCVFLPILYLLCASPPSHSLAGMWLYTWRMFWKCKQVSQRTV